VVRNPSQLGPLSLPSLRGRKMTTIFRQSWGEYSWATSAACHVVYTLPTFVFHESRTSRKSFLFNNCLTLRHAHIILLNVSLGCCPSRTKPRKILHQSCLSDCNAVIIAKASNIMWSFLVVDDDHVSVKQLDCEMNEPTTGPTVKILPRRHGNLSCGRSELQWTLELPPKEAQYQVSTTELPSF